MNIENEQFISIDTNQTIMEEANRRMEQKNEEIEKQRKEICDKTDEIQKLQNEITDMCHDVFELQAGVKELKNENKQLRELVCEFAHYLDCPAYFLRPETEKTIIDIAAEERNRSMNEAKHTPGEWKSFGIYVYQIDGDGYKRRIADCSSKPANIITVDEIMEDSANAHLIAAAPDLLEALKDCCVIARPGNPSSCCPVYRPGEHGGCAENEVGECDVWKAIQKARGQG